MSLSDISLCRQWKTFLLGVGLLTLVSKKTVYVASAEGNIGCLFEESLCMPHLEWCYDDFAFGKCLPQYGLEPEELFRVPLEENQISVLRSMLEELQGAGLGWESPFVQCRMQGALFALRTKAEIPSNLCADLAPEPALSNLVQLAGASDPEAFVRFAPPPLPVGVGSNAALAPSAGSDGGVEESFADEIYMPARLIKKNRVTNNNNINNYETMQPDSQLTSPNLDPRNREILQEFFQPVQLPLREANQEQRLWQRLREEELQRLMDEQEPAVRINYGPSYPYESEYIDDEEGNLEPPMPMHPNNLYKKNSHFHERQELLEQQEARSLLDQLTKPEEPPRTFFRENAPLLESSQYMAPRPFNRILNADNEIPNDYYAVKNSESDLDRPYSDGLYTEGGVLYPDQIRFDNNDEARLLADMLGFTRAERLDVKKPGPIVRPLENQDTKGKADGDTAALKEKKAVDTTKTGENHIGEDHAPHVVDTDFAHVRLRQPVDSWREGERIVNILGKFLKMEPYLKRIRVDRHEVSFFVEPNPEKKSAQDVVKVINDNRTRTNLQRRFGILIDFAGVGDKIKEYSPPHADRLMKRLDHGPDVTHVMAYMFAGAGVAAAVVIVITLFLIKRNDKKKDKLAGLPTGITGAETCSKDYQELCRARMAGKGGPVESGRITSLSKESERPPSSRSSTSSWSEEPALTNMDISTGHMVLSYMEDHLRNKGRLQREWEALCRYEAEPNSKDAALQPECNSFNRPGAPLPYDHSRVVLNHLANAEGMDYINASTITDHDPRAPAYVAAQGPLSATIAHFWQMIWEQGAVVIVALCRLDENGENMCARYWPEEGAETYHIYEVHLVSEHIWCDDYLVRSFYLKNIKTGETRTVTQFHFLSWSQSGVPASAKALLEFRRKVNKSYRGRSCPIVVHSSNGAGRTGAYILLDLVLGRMNKGAREIDIAATLEHLRDQRAGMVATRQQFEFVLMAVAEEVHAILKALPQNTQSEKREIEKEPSKDSTESKDKDKEKKKDTEKDTKKVEKDKTEEKKK